MKKQLTNFVQRSYTPYSYSNFCIIKYYNSDDYNYIIFLILIILY